ncbi:hypothetical protein HHI36_006255 [Cryptolaemus montrouzieri]|uniref:RING-type E3 ubiquitin transferase n=1 Tax=Cryptolaemus montrouzieri TaxID=559131 RepID=A0ABD2NWK5_9CUCU
MADILQLVLVHYECPICNEYAYPPIRQCKIGHVICSSCFDKIALCPTCRREKSNQRSRLLEELHGDVIFPCKYNQEGCRKFDTGKKMLLHQKICIFETKSCPLNVAKTCYWTGADHNMVPHCFDSHPQMTRRGTYNRFRIEHVKDITDKTEIFTIIQAHERGFKLCRCLYKDGHMSWRVLFVSEFVNKYRFEFRIKFEGDEDVCLKLVPTHEQSKEGNIFEGKGHRILDADIIKNLCESNGGCLEYTVGVIDTKLDRIVNDILTWDV